MFKQKALIVCAFSFLSLTFISCKRELPVSRAVAASNVTGNVNAGASPYSVTVGLVSTINSARLVRPGASAFDGAGNIYIYDGGYIKMITPSGVTSIFAGDGTAGFQDGPRLTAKFNGVAGLAFDKSGNLFVGDRENNRVRIITPDGNVSTYAGTGELGFADGPGVTAKFAGPSGIGVDAAGIVYVAEYYGNCIRRISTSRVVTRWAGTSAYGFMDGQGANARFNSPTGLCVTANGVAYVADLNNNRIRRIVSGNVTTYAGSGLADSTNGNPVNAGFNTPEDVAVDANGNVFVADGGNLRVRKISTTGAVSTLAGSGWANNMDGYGTNASFVSVTNVSVDPQGNLYIPDLFNGKIRKITMQAAVATLAGNGGSGYIDGGAATAQINNPYGMTVDAAGNAYTLDADWRVRKISPFGDVTLLAGSGQPGFADGKGAAASFVTSQTNLLADAAGNIFVADGNNQRIRKITPDGTVSTYAGNGVPGQDTGLATGATMYTVSAMAFDASGNMLASQYFPGTIRKITPAGRVTTLATLPTPAGGLAPFPTYMATDAAGNAYVVCTNQKIVYKVTTTGGVSVFATGSQSIGWTPQGITVDKSAGKVYIIDGQYGVVYIYSTTGQQIDGIFTYSNGVGFRDGPEISGQVNNPKAIAIGGQYLYIADQYNNRIRIVSKR